MSGIDSACHIGLTAPGVQDLEFKIIENIIGLWKEEFMTPQIQKQVILSMYQEGHPYGEIADSLLLSPNTVKSICRRSGIKPLSSSETDSGRCRNCGAPLCHTAGAKKKLFCSDQCRYAWWNRKRSKKPYRLVCCQCGETFISYGNKNRKFCGRECYLRSRYGEGLP